MLDCQKINMPLPAYHLGSPQSYRTMNELLDDYYRHNIEQENTGNTQFSAVKHAKTVAQNANCRTRSQAGGGQGRFRLCGETAGFVRRCRLS